MTRSRAGASSRRLGMLLLLGLSALAGGLVYASTTERASSWRDREIAIDGSDQEWQGQELPVRKEHFSLGIVNDGEFLYLCLPTKDVGTKAQIGTAGLVVWLDPVGGKKRRFGLHFPVPNPPQRPGRRRPPSAPGGEGESGRPAEGEADVPGQDAIGVLGPGKNDANLVPLDQAAGIEARVGVHGDLVVYELKVPLKRSAEHLYAPNIDPGQTVRMEIETAPFRGAMTPTGPYGGYGGGILIPVRPWGRGWGATVGGGTRVVTTPIDVTMNVKLAKGPR